jgi:hypothetical protein
MTIQREERSQPNQRAYTTSEIRLTSLQSDAQPIPADFFNLTTLAGNPVAGLLVLMDRKRRPVRAELHLNAGTQGNVQDMAYRQARTLIQDRYFGPGSLTLSVVRDHLEERSAPVELQPPPPAARAERPWAKPAAAAVGIVLVVALVSWGLSGLVRTAPTAEPASLAGSPATRGVGAAMTGADLTEAPSSLSVSQSNASASGTATPYPPQTNNLPESRNALPLEAGQRVRIRPTWRLTLRSEPGVDAGELRGYLQDGATAVILGGPVWKQGESDTIVWWHVRVEATGQEAWAPANTSQLTLLEPAPEP